MKYSYFIADDKYDRFDSPEHTDGNEDYLGREDSNGDCWKCCMTKEDADKAIADHTNEDGSIDYDGLNEDLGLRKGTLDENSHRVDFETDGEVRNTEKGGINDNGQCTGDGQLPGGYSDLEAKNVSRENAIDRGQLKDQGKNEENSSENQEKQSTHDENKSDDELKEQIEDDSETKGQDSLNNERENPTEEPKDEKENSEENSEKEMQSQGDDQSKDNSSEQSNSNDYDYYNGMGY